jgi:hypothetical protein
MSERYEIKDELLDLVQDKTSGYYTQNQDEITMY